MVEKQVVEEQVVDCLEWAGVPVKMGDLYIMYRSKYGMKTIQSNELREAVWRLVAEGRCLLTMDLKIEMA